MDKKSSDFFRKLILMWTQFYRNYYRTIILGLLAIWIIFTASPFQKGGVDEDFYYVIAFFVAAVSVLISLAHNKFSIIERLMISLSFAFLSLFLMTFIVVPAIVDFFYDDKTWVLKRTKNRIFINSIYYGLNAVILWFFINIYFKIRQFFKLGRKPIVNEEST